MHTHMHICDLVPSKPTRESFNLPQLLQSVTELPLKKSPASNRNPTCPSPEQPPPSNAGSAGGGKAATSSAAMGPGGPCCQSPEFGQAGRSKKLSS